MFCLSSLFLYFFFFNDTATTEIYTLSLHDALPIYGLYFVAGYCHDTALGSTRFSEERSKNFNCGCGTTKSYVPPSWRFCAEERREKTFLASSFPPIGVPETIHSEPRYSIFSTLRRKGTESPVTVEAGRKCSGRKPTMTSPISARFIGGEPRKVATKVSAGLS